jgi:hypothetical protein
MSDGPHRSLNMNRRWKRLAECADNRAYSLDEVAKAYLPALDQSCREEVPPGVWRDLANVFGDQQQVLFSEQRIDEIRALRQQVAGQPLGCSLVDLAMQAASRGPVSAEMLVSVATQALIQRAERGNKQAEEHYYRKSSEARTEKLRERLEGALKKAALRDLARQYLGNGATPRAPRSAKQAGLDDGVQL